MRAGMGGVGVLVASAVLVGVLGLAAPAGAGGGDGANADDGAQPTQGVTYSGRVSKFSAKLTAIAPTVDGTTELLVRLRLGCGNVQGDSAVDEQRKIIVEHDGSYSVDIKYSTPPEGGTRDVEIHLSGRFTDDTSTTARFSYDLFDEDDDNNIDSCEKKGELELSGGRGDRGLELVEVGIPVEPDDRAHDDALTTTSADAVYVGLTESFSDGPEASTELFRIDPATNQVVAHQTVPLDLGALVASGPSLYGIDRNGGTLIPLDVTTLSAGPPIQLAPPRVAEDEEFDFALYPSAAVIDGGLWLSATRDQELIRVDPASGAVTARYPIGAHPAQITAGPTGLYVETQSTTIASSGPGDAPETAVVHRIDPATGAILATSPAYEDDTIGTMVATTDGVVMYVTSEDTELVALEPETLAVSSTAAYQEPLVGAPPGVWTNDRSRLRALRPDLSRVVTVPDVIGGVPNEAGTGFDAIWLYNPEQQSLYRIATP